MSLAARPLLRPTRPAASTHRLLDLAAVASDHLRRADGALVAVLAADAPPLALRGPAEADHLIEALRLALAALPWPLQVLVALGPLDVEAAVGAHARATAGEADDRLRRLAADHRAFLRSLARDHRLLERRVYLALAVAAAPDSAVAPSFLTRWLRTAGAGPALPRDEAARELAARCAELDQRLRPCGIALRRLAGSELVGLLHRLVQPGSARRQPLPTDVAADDAAGRRLIDEVAPGAAEETPDWLRVDDAWCATLAVVGYRREVGADWLAALWHCGLPLRVALHLDPLAAGTALARLERRRTRLEAAAAVDARQGRSAKASAAVALEDVTALEEAVERGVERLLMIGLYVTVAAETPAALAERVRSVESLLGGLGLRSVRLTFAQPAGYRATLPLGRDEPQRGQAITGAAVAAAFPFAAASAGGDGLLLGVDLMGGGLVELPAAGEAPNRNLAVLGPSGGGKSFAVKAALLRVLLLGTAVWVVDREGEYAALAGAAGGRTVRLAPGDRGAGLNPLALPATASGAAGEARTALVAERVATVTALVGLLAGGRDGLTPAEEATVELALRAAYDSDAPAAPTLVDLQRRLARGGEPGRGLAHRLARYADGAYAGLFEGGGATADDVRLLRWDLRDLPEDLTAAALLLLADAIWTAARRRPGPRLLVIDEAWRLIAHPAGGRFLADLARRARKHDLGLWIVSQDVRDLLEDPHGRVIAANAAAALLSPQNEVTIDAVAAAFGLGAGERDHLLRARVGEALLVAGRARRAVRVLAPPELAPLITTDPRDRPTGRPDFGRLMPRIIRKELAMRLVRHPDRDPAVLKRRFPIERVVAAAGVHLRRTGPRLVGRCPFHDDRTPSFTVYPDQASYHCFGCGAHGDVIAFVMARERCGFAEAIARLAGGGLTTAPRPLAPPGGTALTPRQRVILTEVATASATALATARALDADLAVAPALAAPGHALLRWRHGIRRADAALAYLRARGVRDEVLGPVGVGWCDGDGLATLARCHGWFETELVDLGLLDRRGRERLAGRVTIPAWRDGCCVWLTGRLIDPALGDRPKYLGVRAPRRALGLEAVAGRERVVIVEGAIDYLVGLGWGLPVLALGGLGLRPDELAALRRAREIVLLLDADRAGRAEAARLAALIGPRARVVTPPPPAKDLADLAMAPDGRDRLLAALDWPPRSAADYEEDRDARELDR